MRSLAKLWVCGTICMGLLALAQTPSRVDFRKDVQPLLRANCIGCHGPTQQMNGFRLDRRSAAMRGGTLAASICG